MLTCPITLEPIHYVVEITTCGHYFEGTSIYELVLLHGGTNCPVCRQEFTANDLYHSRSLQRLCCNTKEASTQTEQHDANQENDDITNLEEYVFRTVSLDEHLINPESKLIDEHEIADLNSRFNNHELINIYRYVYQSNCVDVRTVATQLARSGYLVYDLFLVAHSFPKRYVLYSTNVKHGGRPVLLSKYKRSH